MTVGGNRLLKAARSRRGWFSQEQAAEEIGKTGRTVLGRTDFDVSVRTYRRWESAKPGWPRPDSAAALFAAFGKHPEHLGFTAPSRYLPAAPDDLEKPLERRRFLAVGPVASMTALGPSVSASRHVDPGLIDYFYAQLNGHYAADMLLGPRELMGTITEQYRLIASLARATDGTVRDGLVRVGATYAQLAGWLHQDAGMWNSATYWHGIAHTDACMADDPELAAFALANMAHLRRDLGDGRAAIALCMSALSGRRLSDRIRVNVMQQQAHGASLLGDRKSVDELLDGAARAVEHVDPAIPWGTAPRRNPFFFEVQRATCYGRLGLHSHARRIWDEINTALPPGARRDTGVFLARQATAYACTGEPEQAVVLARDSAAIGRETRSARHRKELAALRTAMERWQGDRIGCELDAALAPLAL